MRRSVLGWLGSLMILATVLLLGCSKAIVVGVQTAEAVYISPRNHDGVQDMLDAPVIAALRDRIVVRGAVELTVYDDIGTPVRTVSPVLTEPTPT